MCHSFQRGTMQMYQIREVNSGRKSKKVVYYTIKTDLKFYLSITYKIIIQLKK
jgi:hypothetical protein